MTEPGAKNSVLDYADGLGGSFTPQEDVEETQLWVSFRLEQGVFGLTVDKVLEVLRVGTMTRVPQAAPGVRGVTNMRGRVLPVLDLRVRLGFEACTVDERSRILVVAGSSGPVGLLVDQVLQMLPVAPSSWQEVPDRLEQVARFALGVVPLKEDLLVLLDLPPVLALGQG